MNRSLSGAAVLLAWALTLPTMVAQSPASPSRKEETRAPWSRSNERFIRKWLVLSDIPAAAVAFDKDALVERGGEVAIKPVEKMTHRLPGGTELQWRTVTSWGDAVDVGNGEGLKRDVSGYAFANVNRKEGGKVVLSIGSDESVRAWVNGAMVLERQTRRQHTFDEDQVQVEMKAGDNALLMKVDQHAGAWNFSARVLERGAAPARIQEIGPSLMDYSATAVLVKTDINKERAGLDKVTVQVVAAGGKVVVEKQAARGDDVKFDPSAWPDGPYELRCTTHRQNGLMYATHIAYYKGDAIAAARAVVAEAAKVDQKQPAGFTVKMLGDMVKDRLGKDWEKVTGNPWWAIHSPLMEFEELRMEAAGKEALARPYGFVRLAYRDEVDGSPQFCRAYLPGGYDRTKKWPLVIQIHGYNGANPEYVRWWAADLRHSVADVEYAGRQGVIYMEPHGRGNTQYLGLGDQDVVRVIQLAKQRFNVDEDRVYLRGDSMGGWGTWNVGTRHPELFAAIAPIFGGVDYHSTSTEDQLAKMKPLDRFLQEKQSSWALADGLLNMPILVHHGDVDQSVNVDYSRYGVKMLQRWGYNVRYVEMPGYGHEDLNIMENIINWFLEHKRTANPAHVRIRSAELQNASAYWAKVEQFVAPNEFMVADARVVGPNTISVDSQNVAAMSLAPAGGLIDAARPVKVVWNGEARTVTAQGGKLSLRAPDYQPAKLEKNARIAGPLGDVINTPFAIVTGTSSADPAMNEICRRKSEALVNFWKQWQNQPPRAFKDTELSDADAARYSLILVGGPEANLAARKLAGKVPLEITASQVKIGGRAFAATDARVQMIYPNPLNAERYVLLIASTSAGGMYFWAPNNLRNAEFDFTIEDGHIPSGRERPGAADLWVAGGWFDRTWQVQDALVIPGDADARSKSRALPTPRPDRAIDTKILDTYVGNYQVGPGFSIKVTRDGSRLMALPGGQTEVEMIPVTDVEFIIIEGPATAIFQKDASGKVVSFKGIQGGQEFTGKKIE